MPEKAWSEFSLNEFLQEHCVALRTGSCYTMGCYMRAGWERGKNHKDFNPTCPAKELSLIIKAYKSLGGLLED